MNEYDASKRKKNKTDIHKNLESLKICSSWGPKVLLSAYKEFIAKVK